MLREVCLRFGLLMEVRCWLQMLRGTRVSCGSFVGLFRWVSRSLGVGFRLLGSSYVFVGRVVCCKISTRGVLLESVGRRRLLCRRRVYFRWCTPG